jgi:hypothetical protein
MTISTARFARFAHVEKIIVTLTPADSCITLCIAYCVLALMAGISKPIRSAIRDGLIYGQISIKTIFYHIVMIDFTKDGIKTPLTIALQKNKRYLCITQNDV